MNKTWENNNALTIEELDKIMKTKTQDMEIVFYKEDVENAIFDLHNKNNYVSLEYSYKLKKVFRNVEIITTRGTFRKEVFVAILKERYIELYEKYKLLVTEYDSAQTK